MAMITSINEAQQQAVTKRVQDWLAIGRSTAPIDRAAASDAIGAMYQAIGRERPTVLWFSSPMMCVLAWGALRALSKDNKQLESQLWSQLRSQLRSQLESQLGSQLGSQLWSQLGSQLWSQLRSQLRSQLESQLWSQLGSQLESQLGSQLESQLGSQLESQLGSQLESQLGSQLWSQLESQLGSQLWSQLGSQLWSQLRSQLWSQLRSQLWSQLSNYFAGAQWCAWEVFYDFCNEIGVQYTAEQRTTLDLWMRQSQHCHWWFPYDGLVIASERPTVLQVDAQGRLHNETGHAIGYSDGWGVHAVHGVQVPADIIEDRASITPERIGGESNAEVRRVMIELYGASRYLLDAGAIVVHQDHTGLLYRKPQQDDEALVMVRLLNSTAEPDGTLTRDEAIAIFGPAAHHIRAAPAASRYKEYFIRVPPDTERACDAVAWTFGLTAETYHPAVES